MLSHLVLLGELFKIIKNSLSSQKINKMSLPSPGNRKHFYSAEKRRAIELL
jgi:hypothetical protein